ncbi:MAG: TetR/AcrR family transcriptional regulator [Bordetella sp.]|uniref:TetR/AcrR family transcriptional regulator n=1 Tax=Bordetella sp. TaxID=28081 RepID=UPI003F7B58D3
MEIESDTRKLILDAAERLFMEQGYEATSTRMVTTAAKVNLAAVNYHFGSKEGLMQAVLRRRLQYLNEERLRVLDEAEAKAAGQPLKPSQIVDGFFGTLLRMAQDENAGGRTFLRLIGRSMSEPASFIRTLLASEYADVMERYKVALFRALPNVPEAEIVWRFHFMLGATSYAIAGTDALELVADLHSNEAPEIQAEKLLDRLMSFLLGGLRAPLPVAT